MVEDRLNVVENRLDKVESDLIKLRRTTHKVANVAMKTQKQLADIKTNTDKMVSFYEGTDRIFGFCRKHWRTALKFGCGFVTAYGFANPAVGRTATYIQHFLNL